jgi:hypothetical protein
LASIGRESCDHFIDDASKAPPIDSFSVSLLFNDFRGQILRSSANGHGFFILIDESFGQAKVRQLNIALLIKEDVFGFEAN